MLITSDMLSVLLAIWMLTSEALSAGQSRNQNFYPERPPVSTDVVPSCNGEADDVTLAYGVTGYNAMFHSPRGVVCKWTTDPDVQPKNSTVHLLEIPDMKTSQNQTCVLCEASFTTYYIFLLIVEDTVPLNFTEKTEFPPSIVTRCYTLYGQLIIFNGSANFTFSCHFTGYPPVQSITWDLGYFNDYDCITYSEDNQSVTLGFSTLLTTGKYSADTVVTCTANNTIESICGMRHIFYPLNSKLKRYLALQSQSSGNIQMNTSHVATFRGATEDVPESSILRVCKVSDTRICLNVPPEGEYSCCSCGNLSCPWLSEDESTIEVSACRVTTNLTGNYQWEGYYPVIGGYQPFGALITVIEPVIPTGSQLLAVSISFGVVGPLLLLAVIVLVCIIVIPFLHKKSKKIELNKSDAISDNDPDGSQTENLPFKAGIDAEPDAVPKITGQNVSMDQLVQFFSSLSSSWEQIGNKLKLTEKVNELEKSGVSSLVKTTILFETWIAQSESHTWQILLARLDELNLTTVSSKIRLFLQKQYVKPSVDLTVPIDIDKKVPLGMNELVMFITSLAPNWDLIGHGLKMTDTVRGLRNEQGSFVLKMTILLENWVQQESVTWQTLIDVLNNLELKGISSKIVQYLNEKNVAKSH